MPDLLFTPSEILTRASQRLQERGWCQYDLALSYRDGAPAQVCLDAALLLGVGVNVPATGVVRTFTATSGHHKTGETLRLASSTGTGGFEDILKRQLGGGRRRNYLKACRYLREVTGVYDLASWNDDDDREVDEVLKALADAAQLASAAGE